MITKVGKPLVKVTAFDALKTTPMHRTTWTRSAREKSRLVCRTFSSRMHAPWRRIGPRRLQPCSKIVQDRWRQTPSNERHAKYKGQPRWRPPPDSSAILAALKRRRPVRKSPPAPGRAGKYCAWRSASSWRAVRPPSRHPTPGTLRKYGGECRSEL